jgi:hypothetical protein
MGFRSQVKNGPPVVFPIIYPITYSCVEACNARFPGYPMMAGSIDGTGTATGTCHGDIFGTACDLNPQQHTYKVGTTYNANGAWSAYVADHGCLARNYCYGTPPPPPPTPPPSPPSPPRTSQPLRARWVTRRARWVTRRARWVTRRARW